MLLVGDLVLDSERLTLPHPEVRSRRFVLVPLLELDPGLALPDGTALASPRALPPGQRVERVASLAGRGIIAACCSRSTSATPRPMSAPSTATELVEHWRFSTDREATGDELAMMIHDLLALRGIGFDAIDGEAVSSVVPQLVSEYRHMFARYLERDALIVGPGTKTGMPILRRQPARGGRRPAGERGRGLRPLPATRA